MPDTLHLKNSGNLFITKALGHPRRVTFKDGKEYPPNPYAIDSSGYYSKEAVPMYDPNRKGMPVVIEPDASVTPVTDYDDWATFLAAGQAAGKTIALLDGVRRLRGCNLCDPDKIYEYDGAVAYTKADILVDVVTPKALTGVASWSWATDANRGKVHPFAGELSAAVPDGETHFPIVGWFGSRDAVHDRVIVRVEFDFANQKDKTTP